VAPALDRIVTELKQADRQDRVDLLIDLAKSLPPLPERLAEFKDEVHRVPECVSPVFLFVEIEDGRVIFHADAPIEAPTVRGFVAMLVEGLNAATPEEILSVPNDLVERSGIQELVGMQRAAGLPGILRRLKAMVTRSLMEQSKPQDSPIERSTPAMPDQEAILSALRTVKDPELGINVVDLGLVYTIQTHDDQVDVDMTLTSPACPAGPEILRNAVGALEKLDGVSKANVKLVMNPPWSQNRMTDAARDELGIF
jgi:cysteine desulfuration protein SufE